ncbi:uncharacterized protein LOC122281319 [Carya illinoinensis]|uniref:Uncharacterized protein n=1 Tax=Carya illinoinensis TaxID=32201 RepID=A0A8T1P775_CARIL|nr:uncharacterized protein LOC122281319 [Carya illinoinensis]KAG6637162.1 hypothetical protein CIPAW_11G160300 [Carya illinoinensis]
MQTPQNLSLSKTLNPSFPLFLLRCPSVRPTFANPLRINTPRNPPIVRCLAGRSKKKKPAGSPPGRIEGNAEFRRAVKEGARQKSKKLAESRFYRLHKNPKNSNHADNFTEDELQEIGLGYDRMVRFMEKDDPRLRHPYDWYKYGEFGPYSWRGVVVGDPIRGRFSDERVTLISEVRDQEEWEKIELFEMASDYGKRLNEMDESKGCKHFWVFVRHPRWRINELPWQQWTLVSEVVVEGGKGRLDKWSLMGRFGNKARALITQCAAWMRPDIIYVKRPVYQCRFEPQEEFFKGLVPLLDPSTEREFLFEVRNEDGSVELCTYFGGLCKIVRSNPKAFVDDVVKAYERLSDERKSECLAFLLNNHPTRLLHPYTKEWKAKLEEMELGCDAPDDDEDSGGGNAGETEIVDWIEDEDNDDDKLEEEEEEEEEEDEEDDEEEDNVVMDMEDEEFGDDKPGSEEDDLRGEEDKNDLRGEEDKKFWEEFRNASSSADAMEKLAKRSVEVSTEFYKQQLRTMEEAQQKGEGANVVGQKGEEKVAEDDGDETALRGKWPKVSPQEWKYAGVGRWRRRIRKTKIPPELFLRAAVRPFTYRNLVKEIVLVRHGIVDGDFVPKV